ncbi:MAG: TolC family protein [Bacteroidales bacterium]|nr:TolC family protein [Bacteroidales bacterium]
MITFTVFAYLGASSQDKEWTLEDCINFALDSNINIKKQVLMVESQKAQLLQDYLIMLPDLNAGATHGYNWGQTVDRYTNQFATSRVQSNNFYLGTQFNLFQGLRQVNTVNQAKLNYEAIQYDLDLMMDDISIAVAGYYLDILFNQEILAVAKAQLEITQQQVNRMQKMVDAGTLARGDLLNIEAQLATEELQVVEAENRLTISYLSIQQLIDHPYSAAFKIETPELKPIEAPQVALTATS